LYGVAVMVFTCGSLMKMKMNIILEISMMWIVVVGIIQKKTICVLNKYISPLDDFERVVIKK